MDANIRVLMDATGCTEAQAQRTLAEAGNDIARALELLDTAAKEVLVILAELNQSGSIRKGFAALIIDLRRESLLHCDIIFPMPDELIGMLDLNMPPTVFVSTMGTVKDRLPERQRGAAASNASNLRGALSADVIRNLISLNQSSRLEQLAQEIGGIAAKLFGDSFTVRNYARTYPMDAVAAVISGLGTGAVDSPESRAARTFKKTQTPELKSNPLDTGELSSVNPQDPLPRIVLICDPEISPFNGKPCRDLEDGEEIIVKIKDGRDSARYFAELLGGAVGDELVPLIVPVLKTNRMSDAFMEVFVEFGPGIYGEFFVPPEVKIKTKTEDMEIYDPFQDEPSLFADEKFGRHIMASLIVLIVATVALIFVFWGLS